MRQSLALKVYVSEKDSEIIIESPDYGGGEQRVFVSPDQVDQLIEWLKEKRDEALQIRAAK